MGIFRLPPSARTQLEHYNLAGERQADLDGGMHKAVYADTLDYYA